MLNICRHFAALTARRVGIKRIPWSEVTSVMYISDDGKRGPTDADQTEVSTWDCNERKIEPAIPDYSERSGETEDVLRNRLQYQSRKRGTLENGLLLSSFCSQHLPSLNGEELVMYDRLINKPSNEWDIYYWVTGAKPIPNEFDNEVMQLLKDFAKNTNRELRITMPDLVKS